jgi:hypothetical protein
MFKRIMELTGKGLLEIGFVIRIPIYRFDDVDFG